MYWANKIVAWLTSPMGVMFIGLGLGLFLSRRGKAWGRWIAVAALAWTWAMGCGVTTRLIGPPLEAEYSAPGAMHGDLSGLPAAEAIVVLGGGMAAHRECGAPEMQAAADRVWTGAKLWKLGKSPLVALSGGDAEAGAAPLLADLGVDRAALRFFPDARNTEEEARELAAMGVKRILLVTSAWHMPRATMLFGRAGFDVIPAPADFEMNCAAEQELRIGDFFPNADALNRNSVCMKEWIALLLYRMVAQRGR